MLANARTAGSCVLPRSRFRPKGESNSSPGRSHPFSDRSAARERLGDQPRLRGDAVLGADEPAGALARAAFGRHRSRPFRRRPLANAIVRTGLLEDALVADCRAPGTRSAFVLVPRQNLGPSVAELATGAIPASRSDRPGVTGFVRNGHVVVPLDAPGSWR